MITERIIHAGLNFLIIAIIARSLGIEILGVFCLVQSVYFVGLPVALFVEEQVLIKLFVTEKHSPSQIQKAALILKYTSTIIIYSLTISLSYWFFDERTFKLVAIFCLIHFVNIELIYFF
jgi:O-antigen/teichoic acid export membrane protein